MKKYFLILFWGSFAYFPLEAQNSIQQVLESITQNNIALRAESQKTEASKLEAQTGKYLPNPTVELNQLWADRSVGGNVNELAVVQAFDFPSVYAHKNKLAQLKVSSSDYQYAAAKQQILLTAQQTCLEIIYLRKQQQLLENRQKNALRLSELYQQRLESGDANQLELNKILLEKVNAQNAARLNRAALQAQLEKLQTLNGGVPLAFTENEFGSLPPLPEYPLLETEYLSVDPTLKSLLNASETANREIRLSRALTLPKFDLGYRRNGGSEEKLNGFRIGMSIPLWENKNTVKQAKAQAEYAAVNAEQNLQNLKSTLQQLYAQAQAYRSSCVEYAQALQAQRNEELLNKALEAGQISMIDYFVEITILYDSLENYLNVEKEYFNLVAQLFQYQLPAV